MKYFKHTLWIASLLVLLLPGCSNEEEATPVSGDLTLTLTIPGAQQSTRATTDPLPGESTLTNVYLLFYDRGAANADKPVFFHNAGDLNATSGTWMKQFRAKDLQQLKEGSTYEVYALASLNIGLAKLQLPTSATTKGELLALNDYRCYCESDQAVSFSAITTYAGGDGLLPIDLIRTVARFDVTYTLPVGHTLQGIGIDHAPTYSPLFAKGPHTTGKDSIFHTPEAGAHFYPFSTTGLTPEADHRMKLSVYTTDADGFECIYTAPIDQEIVRNTIYSIHASLQADKTMTLTLKGIDWTSESNNDNGALTPEAPSTSPEANAYLVAPGGNPVFIPVSQANAARAYNPTIPGIGAGDELIAELVWTDVKSTSSGLGIACDAPVQDISLLGKGSEAILKVTPGTVPGNALIAVKDKATGTIRWSWHIWVTNMEEKTYKSGSITYTFMDRHLGATSITPGDLNTYGLAYQWGRKDPFPQAGATTVNYAIPRVFYDAAGNILVENKSTDINFNIAKSIANPWQINAYYGGYYWNIDRNGTMWGSGKVKTVYDPCPAGWRVPEQIALTGITLTNFKSADGRCWGRTNPDLGFFPLAGRRIADNFPADNASVWCFLNVSDGSANGDGFYHYRFTEGSGPSMTWEYCEYAISVRCLKIVTP